MKQILRIAQHNVRMFFVRPWAMVLLLSPILLSVVASQFFGADQMMSMGKVGIYTKDESRFSQIVEEELMGQGLQIQYYEQSDMLKEAVAKEKIDLGLMGTSDNIYDTIKQGGTPFIATKLDESKVGDEAQSIAENKLGQIALLIQESESEAVFYDKYEVVINHKPTMVQSNIMQDKLTMTIVFSFFVMMFLLTVGVSLSPMMREKEQYVYTRILSSPIKRCEYVLGHLMGGFIIVFGQLLLQLLAMRMLSIDFNLNNLQFIGIGIILCAVGLAISMLILSFSKNSTIYYLIMGTGVTPLCMFSDTFFPVELFPDWLEKLSYLSPIRWIMMSYRGMINGIGTGEIVRSLMSALLIAGVLILISLVKESKGAPLEV